ncbi:hypothetical protein F4777DRAFT_419666 [Nemania sp. FL0916]|nr:hypothetical protein F4777DRAFT_419666 [Nemania sp. FL0916]
MAPTRISSFLSLLPALALLAGVTEGYSPRYASPQRRQLKTCEETYGKGFIPCGGPEGGSCINPAMGQTCCPLDHGFCNRGEYCAPVAGYCCVEGDDLESCARSNGFDLPRSATDQMMTPDPTVAAPTGSDSRTFTVSPFLTANPTPASMDAMGSNVQDDRRLVTVLRTQFVVGSQVACGGAPAPSFTSPAIVQIANTSSPPLVQRPSSFQPPSSMPQPSMPQPSMPQPSVARPSAPRPTVQPSAPIPSVVQISTAVQENRPIMCSIVMMAVAGVFALL